MTDDRLDEPAHARNSPSDAEGWMNCLGKPNAEAGLPDDVSIFAAEGTAAHEVADECLSNPLGYEPWDFVGHVFHFDGFDIEFDEDMAEALSPGIEWIRAQLGTFYGERRVDLTEWLGLDLQGRPQKGTLDRGIIAPDIITINELKFGRGIPVSPVRNKQMMLYGLGFWRAEAPHITDPNFPIHLVIDQPRCAGGGGEWTTTLGELLAFGEEVKLAAEATKDPNAPRTAGDKQCFFCRRRKAPGGCETHQSFVLDVMGAKFEDLDSDEPLVLPRPLTPERRSYVLRHAKMIEKWTEQLHEEALADALKGEPTPGLKAVEGRKSPDKWPEDKSGAEAAVVAVHGAEKAFTKKLITPTQACKKIFPEDLKIIEPFIVRGSKKPILVDEADAREALTPHDAKFDEILE